MRLYSILSLLIFLSFASHAQQFHIGGNAGILFQHYRYQDAGGYIQKIRFLPNPNINPGFRIGYRHRDKLIFETGANKVEYSQNVNFMPGSNSSGSASSGWVIPFHAYYPLFSLAAWGFPRTKVYGFGGVNLHLLFRSRFKGMGTSQPSGTVNGQPFMVTYRDTVTMPRDMVATVELGTSIRYAFDRKEHFVIAMNVSRSFGFAEAVVTNIVYSYNGQSEVRARTTSSGAGINLFATLYYSFSLRKRNEQP